MSKKSYKKYAVLMILAFNLIFSLTVFAQTPRQQAERYKREGDRQQENKNYKAAVDWYMKALEADKEYAPTYASLGFALSKLHEHKLAASSFLRYLERVIDDESVYVVYVLYLIGNEYRLAQEYELSDKSFDLALKTEAKHAPDLDAASNIYSYRGNLVQAVAHKIRAINFSNNDTNDDLGRYVSLSWYYSFLQEHQKAVDAATKAIQIDNTEAMAYTNRCRAYNDLKLYDRAIADCNRALSLVPNHGETQYYLANAYRGKGNKARATELNRTAIPNLGKELRAAVDREDLNLSDYCYLLGNAFFQDGRYKDAAEAYQVGLQLRANAPFVRFNLGMTYLKLGNKIKAMEQYRELLRIDTVKANALKKQIDAAR